MDEPKLKCLGPTPFLRYVSLLTPLEVLFVSVVIGCNVKIGPSTRTPLMVNLYLEACQYASEHGGFFPATPQGGATSLQMLYPGYCHTGKELAGLTGDIDAVVATMRTGGSLSTNQSSWIYVGDGLKLSDNPRLALFWERQSGVFPSGERSRRAGRSVMLLSGTITNVPAERWSQFMNEQQRLRSTAH